MAGGRGGTAVHALRMLGTMQAGLGDHRAALRTLGRALGAADSEGQRLELLFLRGTECCGGAGGREEGREEGRGA